MTLDYADIGNNTFIMKNEVLSEDTLYVGLPAVPEGKSRMTIARENGFSKNETDGEPALQRKQVMAFVILAACIATVVLSIIMFQKP